jgi:hypothetical protein
MAQIDSENLGGSYEVHYENLSHWSDFALLGYWLTYNGVFDGGEDRLKVLKILINKSI